MLVVIVFRLVSIMGLISQDVLYFQMVEWYFPVAILILSALSTQKE
jgi:hypothetical protein